MAQVYIMGTQKDFLLPFAHREGKQKSMTGEPVDAASDCERCSLSREHSIKLDYCCVNNAY
jgi:hypothetical protein